MTGTFFIYIVLRYIMLYLYYIVLYWYITGTYRVKN